jgi:hypothetical protein
MQTEIDELKSQVNRLTPQNSSVPPSTQHPHTRPTTKPKPKSRKLLGDPLKVIINYDRAKRYWQAKQLQRCGAHLKRDLQSRIDHHDHQVKRLRDELKRLVESMFLIWYNYRSNSIAWKTFQSQMRHLRKSVNSLLLHGVYSGNQRLIRTCRELYNSRKWPWTFTEVEGIEPTNNAAEQALRLAVIYRKLWFGTQSEKRSRFVERMLMVSEISRLQKRSAYQWITEAVEASLHEQQAPSLFNKP